MSEFPTICPGYRKSLQSGAVIESLDNGALLSIVMDTAVGYTFARTRYRHV
jgi:hypothetical protein